MKRLVSIIIFAAISPLGWSQVAIPISGIVISQYGQPVPGAQVRVCLVTSTGVPCVPTVSLFQDYGMTLPASNPYIADSQGNYTVYAPLIPSPGLYLVQVSPQAGTTYSYVVNGNNAVNPVSGCNFATVGGLGNITCSGTGTFGTLDIGGSITTPKFSMYALSTIPASWTLDVTTPGTANLSITGVTQTGTLGTSSQVSTFPGTVAAPATVVGVANGIYNVSNFGVKCDGITDDSTALNAIGTFAATQTSAGKTITVEFPSNATCVHASEITTWLVESLHIHGNGSRLKFTGTGTSTNGQVYLHGSANEIDNLELSGLVLQGNANSTWGVYQDNGILAHSTIDLLNVQDQNTGCFYMADFEISRKANFICSSILANTMGVAQTTQPEYGLIAGDPTAYHAGYFANNAVVNLTIEGPALIGLWCKHCTVSNHFFGTTEDVSSSGGTVGVGIQDYGTAADGESSGNTFEMDSEANGVSDINAGGFGDIFLNSVANNFTAILHGFGYIIGGVYNNITLAAGHGAWTLIGPTYNISQTSGTFTDATPSLTTTMFLQNRISWPVPDSSTFNGAPISWFDTGNSNIGGSLPSATTGVQNSAEGQGALYSNTTGSFNSAQGYQALYKNTTGSFNSAQGYQALYKNTTGEGNSAQGLQALYSNTTGSYNSAQGFDAGFYISGGVAANAASSNSIYLGANTEANASGDTNETVIGYEAVGNGSNTTTLGNSSVIGTYYFGALHGPSARKGTFICTNAGTITISNTNELVTSDVIISLNTAGGTITTPPAMNTVTSGTGFTVLCGASDTSTYNYNILN